MLLILDQNQSEAFQRLCVRINKRMLVRDGSGLREFGETARFGIYNIAWDQFIKDDLDIFDVYDLGEELGVCIALDHQHLVQIHKALMEVA